VDADFPEPDFLGAWWWEGDLSPGIAIVRASRHFGHSLAEQRDEARAFRRGASGPENA